MTASLPRFLTSLAGRSGERERILDLLDHQGVRLLTLSGPGGVGKTRLAVAVAGEVAQRDGQEVAFVDLTAIPNPDAVLPAIAQAFGLTVADQPVVELLASTLGDRHTLLVLDNFEAVIDAAPDIAALVVACAGLRFMVTSRERLGVDAEVVFSVPPLQLPATGEHGAGADVASAEAVALFVARARAVAPQFTVTEQNADAVVRICQKLDALPLAIELAAARVDILPPPAMLARLEQGGALPTSAGRDRPPRQRTMHDAIAWSYDLLAEEDRQLFRRVAVFAGGFNLDVVEAVCGADALDGLASLADKNLLQVMDDDSPDARFRMLETVHAFARGRLVVSDEVGAISRAHALYFLDLAERAEHALVGNDQETWLRRLDLEHANVRAAIDWAVTRQDGEIALRLAGSLTRFWTMRGHIVEGKGWLESSLAIPGQEATLARAKALHRLAVLCIYLGDYGAAKTRFQDAGHIADELNDRPLQADVLTGLGIVAADLGNVEGARRLHTAALAIRRELPDTSALALSLYNLGTIASAVGDFDDARALFAEALALRRALGDSIGTAYATLELGKSAAGLGDQVTGTALVERALMRFRGIGDLFGTGYALLAKACLTLDRGQHRDAAMLFAEALGLLDEPGGEPVLVAALEGLAAVALALGDPKMGGRLFASAAAARESLRILRQPVDEPAATRLHELLQETLGEREIALAMAVASPLADVVEDTVAWVADVFADEAEAAKPDVGLTPREWEVLRLMVEGRTDPEIAEALFMAPRTASWHVGHVLMKLGAESRTSAVVIALRNGLL